MAIQTDITTHASRRGFLSGAAGLAAGGAVLAMATISAVAVELDPVFSAIDAHKAAQAAEEKIGSVIGKMHHVPDDLELKAVQAMDAEIDAFNDLLQTAPTTAAGRAAWLSYLVEYTDGQGIAFHIDGDMFAALLETIQESLALS